MDHLKPHKSVEQIAKKHRLEVSFVKHQLEMGIPIEHEHTKDKVLATDIALQHLDEIPDYYTRLKKMEASAKKEHKKFRDVKEETKSGDEGLHDWFNKSKSSDGKKGWVQLGGKWAGKPCARQPGQTSTPKCGSSKMSADLSAKEEEAARRRKNRLDPNQPEKTGASKPTNVRTEEMDLQEVKDKASKGSGKKDACYNKVKSRYSVWPSAYASGALVKCRKVGAANWGTKSEAANLAQQAAIAINMKKKGIKPKSEVKEDCWDGYKQEGMKKKGKKMVPNCVPVKEASEMIRYCPKCAKEESRNECKYGPKYWDMYSMPIKLKDYTPNTPHPGNFPESVDHEYSMARSEISTIISAAKRLRKKIGKGEGNLEAWVQSKITKAADYIDTAADYVDSGEMKEETSVAEKPATPEEKKKIAKMRELHRLMKVAKAGRATSDVAKESVNIEDANGNHYAEFIDIIKPEPLKASRGIGSQLVSEAPGDGYIGPPQLGIKNPLASDATRAQTDAKRKQSSQNLLNKGGQANLAAQRDATELAIKQLNNSYELNLKTFNEFMSEASAAWQRKEGKNPEGGLNKKGIASYRKEHPGSHLSLAVTTEPSKLKPGSKKANRRKSFCSRMKGMKKKLTSAKTANDPNSRINKSLRKWNC